LNTERWPSSNKFNLTLIDIYNFHQTTESICIKFGTGFVNLKIFEDVNFVYNILIKFTHQVKTNSTILPQKNYFNVTKNVVHITLRFLLAVNYLFKAQCLLYVPPEIITRISTFRSYRTCMCFVCISKQTAIISLRSFNSLMVR
jgi:hypothetical protein